MPPSPTQGPSALVAWADEQGVAVDALLGSLVVRAAQQHGLAVGDDVALVAQAIDPADVPQPEAWVAPDDLGRVLAAARAPVDRRSKGAVFTPRATAEGLVRVALGERDVDGGLLLDPSVGGGAFALALARSVDEGDPAAAAARVVGVDVDPLAVAVTSAALALWVAMETGTWVPIDGVHEGDFLLDGAPSGNEPVAAVVGNPPFRGQLRRLTARSPAHRTQLQQRFGALAGTYTDDAALFLVAALDLVAPGGVVALVQPRSFLAAQGTEAIRHLVAERAAMVALWEPTEQVFDAAVHVCAPVLVAGSLPPSEVRVHHAVDLGGAPTPVPVGSSVGAATMVGRDLAPPCSVGSTSVLADRATVTAGFRDQFYGLAPHVAEASGCDDARPRLVTSGLIDAASHRWGTSLARFAGRRWRAPVVDLVGLPPADGVGRWVRERLVPKLVVASQTKVVEAAADPDGRLVPSPPVVSVEPHEPLDQLGLLLAALSSPVASAWLHRRAAGSGLAPNALRVSARDLRALPLPVEGSRWRRAAALLDGSALVPGPAAEAFGRAACAAYDLPTVEVDALVRWWAARLPRPPSDEHR